ncbi:hypothetical protein CDL15_Pgr024081 [Punica granatum]|uniref:Malectin-like domain-containing protein n=1 Tax=Punica granatum TaxID=22663 RepID=A0A218XWK1_PUNGR|nr:hypothetical protein CDL15_Pgr024081 [Punica granatum]
MSLKRLPDLFLLCAVEVPSTLPSITLKFLLGGDSSLNHSVLHFSKMNLLEKLKLCPEVWSYLWLFCAGSRGTKYSVHRGRIPAIAGQTVRHRPNPSITASIVTMLGTTEARKILRFLVSTLSKQCDSFVPDTGKWIRIDCGSGYYYRDGDEILWQNKNHYILPVTTSRRYFIKEAFHYGNYDGLSQAPTFDLKFDGNKWTTVSTNFTNIVP